MVAPIYTVLLHYRACYSEASDTHSVAPACSRRKIDYVGTWYPEKSLLDFAQQQ